MKWSYTGTLPFFSQELDLKLTFEPEALENGDLVLKQKSISVGSLHLPVSYVLKFIKENYKLPKGVDIQPNEKLIYVNMQQLKLKSDVEIKANRFDLQKMILLLQYLYLLNKVTHIVGHLYFFNPLKSSLVMFQALLWKDQSI